MKFIFKYIPLFFICLGSFAQNITSPQIECVNVLPNGNVVLTWQPPSDPNHQFASYVVYSSTTLNNPSYTQQATIYTYSVNSCTIGINANTSPYYFYIQTITTSSVTLQAVDSVRAILLSVSVDISDAGVAHLAWNGFSKPIPAGEASSYSIYKEYPVSTNSWSLIASVPFNANGNINYDYYDTITVCSDTINYKIELTNTLGCTSVSNITGKHFRNTNKPTPPNVDSVSVYITPTGQEEVIMGISPAYSKDVMCFVIWTFSVNTNVKLDSICNYNHAATYIYSVDPSGGSITMTSISKDSCYNQSEFPNHQKTIYTNAYYDVCKKANVISWTKYINMITGVDHYEIFCSVNNGVSYTSVGITTDSVTNQYIHYGAQPGTNYCYYVRAHSVGKTIAGKDTASSTSNRFCFSTAAAPVSHFAYLNNVSINAQQTIDLQWYVDNRVPIAGYNLYRSTTRNGPYTLMGFIASTNLINNSYTDVNVNTNLNEYFYYIQVLDTCKNPTIKTDTSNSILLKAVASANLTATLHWNNYALYLGGVSGYNVYRSVNGIFGIAATNVAGTSYVDDLSPFVADEGTFIYYVEAVEGTGDPYAFAEKSQSNYDTIYVGANIYIPNSFTPNGKNKVFLPIGAYIDNSDYQLNIFDRFGQKIYETTDPNTGWNGGGHEEGVYAYTVQYKTSVGEFRQCHGTVNLIR